MAELEGPSIKRNSGMSRLLQMRRMSIEGEQFQDTLENKKQVISLFGDEKKLEEHEPMSKTEGFSFSTTTKKKKKEKDSKLKQLTETLNCNFYEDNDNEEEDFYLEGGDSLRSNKQFDQYFPEEKLTYDVSDSSSG
jgi:hypothetical protein